MISFSAARNTVKSHIGSVHYNVILQFLLRTVLGLWGSERLRNYTEVMFVLTLYHDCFKRGYRWIVDNIDVGVRLAMSTLLHNALVIRRQLAAWGRSKMPLGDLATWRRAAARLDISNRLRVSS